MARKTKQDEAKAKAAKQKKIAIGGAVVLAALLAFELPKTMKMLNSKPAPLNVVGPTATTASPTVTPSDPNSLAAPTLAGTPVAPTVTVDTSNLVSAVPVSADPGQLEQFQKFATKDPFATQVNADGSAPSAAGSKRPSGGSSAPKSTPAAPSTPSTPSTPSSPAVAPTTAIISLNGELMSVAVASDFPSSGATFNRFGALFHLVSLTAKTAKIAVAGGSYASGAPTITLHMGTPVTLQNTADGTKYTIVLEPPTTQLPTGTATTGSAAGGTVTTTTPTSTVSAVPSGSGG